MIPTEFSVEVDGEQFNVRVSPLSTEESIGSSPDRGYTTQTGSAPKEIPEGGMISDIVAVLGSLDPVMGEADK